MLSLLKSWFGGKKSQPSRRYSRPSVRPTLESLEERCLPSTLTVTRTSDFSSTYRDLSAAGPGTLRNAVNTACADASRGVSDTIMFANSLNGATIKLDQPLYLNDYHGNGTITIDGTAGPTISAGRYSAFLITYGTNVHMNNLVVKNCGTAAKGGAVINNGSLVLHNVKFDNNYANLGGAIYNTGNLTMSTCYFDGNGAYASGGAIYNLGTVNAYGCWFDFNGASEDGGAIYNGGVLYVLSNGNIFAQNHAAGGPGGAIFNATNGTATVRGSFFSNNTSATSGGAIANYGNIDVESGITFYRNHATYYGGAFFDGPGAPWYLWASWNGNTAGLKGATYYIAGTGQAG